MDPIKKIKLPDWAQSDDTHSLISALQSDDTKPQAMFVGGCVRNMLLGEKVTDIDIATKLEPEEVQARLDQAGIKHIPTGIDHGTITAVISKKPFEITSLRKDIQTDGRHAVVSYTKNWQEDASRRDFTINTFLMDVHGGLYDPIGSGVEDLNARRIVFVGEAEQRIKEDVLRILRFFRFQAWYGSAEINNDALVACQKLADKIPNLSKQRVTNEILKLLAAPNPASVLEIMFDHGVLSDFPSPLYDSNVMELFCAYQQDHPGQDQEMTVVSRLFVLAGLKANDFADHLILSNQQKKTGAELEKAYVGLTEELSEKALKIAIYRYGNAVTYQIYMLSCVLQGVRPTEKLLDLAKNWQAPKFPITGEDLIKQGYKPSADLGKKLKELELEWINNIS